MISKKFALKGSFSILILLDSILLYCRTNDFIHNDNRVSILILLDSLLLSLSMYKVKPYNIEFQSLFYWILFFYHLHLFYQAYSLFRFNPYSTGFSSFIKRIRKCHQVIRQGFNPYSTGFSSFIRFINC